MKLFSPKAFAGFAISGLGAAIFRVLIEKKSEMATNELNSYRMKKINYVLRGCGRLGKPEEGTNEIQK